MQERRIVTVNWEALLAERLRSRRGQRGWRQLDVAHKMTEQGYAWNQPIVAAIELEGRECSVLELLGLASAFGRSLRGFLSPDPEEAGYAFDGVDPAVGAEEIRIEYPTGVHVGLLTVLGAIDGTDRILFGVSGGPTLLDWPTTLDPMITKLARVLDVDPGWVVDTAARLWGRPPQVERDERLGDITDVPARTVQARRGHITRAMTAEMRKELH